MILENCDIMTATIVLSKGSYEELRAVENLTQRMKHECMVNVFFKE